MLSSVANRIYWAARYLERAENTARLINVYTTLLLDLPESSGASWNQMVRIAGCSEQFAKARRWPLERSAIRFMTADLQNSSSIHSSIRAARENLRTLRDLVPAEAFEAVNELSIFANRRLRFAANRRVRFAVLSDVVEKCQQLTGLFAGTMSHNQAYQFMRLGRNLERADMTTRILDVAGDLLEADAESVSDFDTTLWVNVLRTLSAYQAYRQSVRSRISPVRVLFFLIADPQFPRSVTHCLGEMRSSVAELPANEDVCAAIDRVEDSIAQFSLRELAREQLHESMDAVQQLLGDLHQTIVSTWITPSWLREAEADAQA